MAAPKMHVSLDELHTVEPKTQNQAEMFYQFDRSDVLLLHGYAGTGKSFLSIYKALETILTRGSIYDKLLIVRSAVSARDIGHLPGDEEEKSMVYQRPYEAICESLFSRKGSYMSLKYMKKLFFELSSFQRGMTYDNVIMVVDEIQNLTYQELSTIITRVGIDSKLVLCGDTRQSDLNGKSGLIKFMKVLDNMSCVSRVNFDIEDIVRSDIVKEFIIEESKLYGSE